MDKKMFYSYSQAEDKCIGHLRIDFGKSGKEFYHSWFSHEAEKYNDAAFRKTLQSVVDNERKTMLKDRKSMRNYFSNHDGVLLEEYPVSRGFVVNRSNYEFYIRCTPHPGYYDAYIYCYIKEA